MHVIIYTPHWKKGGIERVAKYLSEGLSQRRSDIKFSIITEDIPDPPAQYALSQGIDIYFRSFAPFNEAKKRNMRELLARLNPDVVIAMASNRTLYKLPRALAGLPYPIILSEHNSPSEIVKNFHGDFRFLNAVRNIADFNHVLFPGYAAEYPHQDKVRSINNPVLLAEMLANVAEPSSGRYKILNVSRYDLGQKQQDILVKSFAKLAEKHPQWDVELHGGDWFGGRQKLRNLISSLGLSDRIKVNDATDKVGQVLASGAIFAFPSAFEGSPLVVGEALAHGLPIVGFKSCEGVRLVVQDGMNGILVDSSVRNADAFARALEKMMVDTQLRVSTSSNAVASVKARTLDRFLDEWERLLEEAFALKGRNLLSTLTPMQADYVELVGSGQLFDELAKAKKAAKQLARIERFFARYKLKWLVDRLFKWM